MARNVTVPMDAFARGIEELIGDLPDSCAEKVGKATEQATRKGVKTVKAYASRGGRHKWSDEYVGGFSSRVIKGVVTEGEIGNKAKPGLVHLLEKGHLTLTGRRTGTFPHMAPAFNEIQEDFIERVDKAVWEALR